ncbi:TPA: ABC transporter permease [Pseudomonas putida]|nr:ABC transporter permease [Pseudomonas putida]
MPECYGPSWPQRMGEALAGLRQAGRRTGLALIGIAVGCAALVALLNIGHSAAQHAHRLYQGMGSELLVANLQAEAAGVVPATLDLAGLPASIRAAAPLMVTVATLQLASVRQEVMVAGSTLQLAPVLGLEARQGRLLSSYDDDATHVLLGAALALHLNATVGDYLQLGRYLFEVVGVLAPRGYNPLLPLEVDEALLMPLAGMRRLGVAPQVGMLLARGHDAAGQQRTAQLLARYLRARLPGHDVDVQLPQQLLEGMANQSRMFNWMLGGFAGIALLLGGVGVMNVMLMSVTQRRREIGVRLALGARARDIAWLFLLEAVLLAAGGAVLGALLGLVAAAGFVLMSGWGFALHVLSIPLGMGSALALGLFFGLQPALAAARLQPVLALRDD